jgi:glyoxylase-like metal-dependent hydrolase (beta-lactamase superfamily II)
MKRTVGRIFAGVMTLIAISVSAQDEPAIRVTRLSETLFRLTTDQGAYTTNAIASVGEDGLLLVDTQAESDAEGLKRVVRGFGKGNPKVIINTHRHVEHVGGNAIFGNDPVVVAHDLVPAKLRSGSYLFNEFAEATFPDITFKEKVTLFFNGEEIRLIALPGSHDDNEIIVHFTKSKVVHLSSLVNGFNFPSVDSDGDALKFAELVERAIELLPEDVVIVSGHNQNGSYADLIAYHEMLVATTEVVRRGLDAGKDTETLQAEKALDDWESYAGSYVSVDRWIEYLVDAFEGSVEKASIYEPLYYALRDGGPEAAIELHGKLKSEQAEEYDFNDVDLLIIGDKLLEKGRTEAAILFLELSLKEYPEGDYTYYVNYDLAVAHERSGNRKTAIRFCETALDQKPESEMISAFLEGLKKPK